MQQMVFARSVRVSRSDASTAVVAHELALMPCRQALNGDAGVIPFRETASGDRVSVHTEASAIKLGGRPPFSTQPHRSWRLVSFWGPGRNALTCGDRVADIRTNFTPALLLGPLCSGLRNESHS